MRYIVSEQNPPPLRTRPDESHKGTFGTVAALVGSPEMTGAAVLSCSAAMRSGVGLLKACVCDEVASVLRTVLPEAICLPVDKLLGTNADAYLFGCGCGREYDAVFADIFPRLDKPAVIDADGINFLAAHIDILQNTGSNMILTPHPAEFARLTGKSISEIQQNRESAAKEFSDKYGCVTVLKGHNTVTAYGGDVYVNTTGGSELAKGGSGDVLAGVIASLIAQGYDKLTACMAAVYLHGLAGQQLRTELGASGTLPSDVIKRIGLLLG